MNQETLVLDGGPLSGPQVVGVARNGVKVEISPLAIELMEAARATVAQVTSTNDATYGINTGFGALSTTRIDNNKLVDLQMNLLRSHAAGVGEPLEGEIVRGMMILLTANLCRGHSGVRPEVAQCIVEMINAGVTPVIPSRGSVGASGDLAPLAHLALVLCGEGNAVLGEKEMPGKAAMAAAGITPIVPIEKEGLALINGTHLMTSIATLGLADIAVLCEVAVLATAMSIDTAKATNTFLDQRLHAARIQSGQQTVASTLRAHLVNSTILTSHQEDDQRVQDPYSFRCSPQVLGAAIEAIARVTGVVSAELGAVTDNPLVFPKDNAIISGGNFHGMPLAIAMDELRIALCHIAGIAERRIEWILSGRCIHNNLPAFCACDPGLESGLMIVQYTAAACCAELRTLSMPASVSNISTSGGIEDYNSMGATSALMLRRSINLCRSVIAIELLVGCDALDYHRPLKSGDAVEHLYSKIREVVPERNCDRSPSEDIAAIEQLLH
ncbi:MAG: histidine ammonia-lyase [Phycisphaerales bacterium]|nr:histidine ammonia-lyase [Planctomycetota bacterium]MBL6997617.1 histidine ammonia-lyase [Phycisphaerales bacterium]